MASATHEDPGRALRPDPTREYDSPRQRPETETLDPPPTKVQRQDSTDWTKRRTHRFWRPGAFIKAKEPSVLEGGQIWKPLQERTAQARGGPVMGKIGRKKDTEVKDESNVSALPGSQARDPTLQDILQAITASCEVLGGKIDALATDLTILRDDHRRLGEKVAMAEKQIEEILPSVSKAANAICKMEKQIHDLELGAEVAENRREQIIFA
ncbi:hypothetical protein NDU88_003264 [Pleurodeles waltl]|uniref:Uncharacterized protein n=1 Tax=Pleurodeles waltl TaxID=8319 RepID=A0AAV7W1M7_PLEWA|nr:hypothetical protein NDU88_003264 [Pleurodeles waltl]